MYKSKSPEMKIVIPLCNLPGGISPLNKRPSEALYEKTKEESKKIKNK